MKAHTYGYNAAHPITSFYTLSYVIDPPYHITCCFGNHHSTQTPGIIYKPQIKKHLVIRTCNVWQSLQCYMHVSAYNQV